MPGLGWSVLVKVSHGGKRVSNPTCQSSQLMWMRIGLRGVLVTGHLRGRARNAPGAHNTSWWAGTGVDWTGLGGTADPIFRSVSAAGPFIVCMLVGGKTSSAVRIQLVNLLHLIIAVVLS